MRKGVVSVLDKAVKPVGRIFLAANGFFYDFCRYVRHGGWRQGMLNAEERDYTAAKLYHSLEKSMSFRNRRPGAGWSVACSLKNDLLAISKSREFGFQENVALGVLHKFSELPEEQAIARENRFAEEICGLKTTDRLSGGVVPLSNLEAAKLDNPERFFGSRHSLRDFSDQAVEASLVHRAIRLAMRSPSACNRQAWHVYHVNARVLIDRALGCQSGNRGFGDDVNSLLIVTSDIRAFVSGNERYQHWIDGGMFSMSLILALHSLGVGSCSLNWSQSPTGDRKLRRQVPINNHHTIVMFLAIGYPNEGALACASERRPFEEVYTFLGDDI